ncbi:hypothetical protein Ciccas_010970 [Cichlidogyrus casuarinus]|uniref:Peptidase A2 domain-containing protein n=1 Tax=Cichlidogyrus casuarinus TaxID=1844966 RepID=A0ABD2PTE2_9PLAT
MEREVNDMIRQNGEKLTPRQRLIRVQSMFPNDTKLQKVVFYAGLRPSIQDLVVKEYLTSGVEQLEDLLSRMNTREKSPQVPEQLAIDDRDVVCWNCNQRGHRFFKCNQPKRRQNKTTGWRPNQRAVQIWTNQRASQKRTRTVGKAGRIMELCELHASNISSNDCDDPSHCQAWKVRNTERLFVFCEKFKKWFLIDTGARMSICSFIPEPRVTGWSVRADEPVRLRGFNGPAITCSQKIKLNISVGKNTLPFEFVLIEGASVNIIGIDFLKRIVG